MNNNTKRILVVDDEQKIVEVLKSYLENANYVVSTAFSGYEALLAFEKHSPSLVILDLMLPDMPGEEVCKILRKRSRVPIIMLTAKIQEEDILRGLDIGADDYVTKPFSPKQLVARVAAHLRRVGDETGPLSNIISFGEDLVIDTARYEIKKRGHVINLTPNEYKLLMTMIKYPSKTFTREELVDMVLGQDYDGYDRTIDTHIKNIRQKIETDSKAPEYILTVHGVGYKFGGG
ncbi:DNA-binding response OmpR family regulator [Anaerobacterium chartisolvens]|uniref:Stage 0 sporulation protein A homolog n=1 Tax=Anaerobacterium chartisolvens TaxID=1297424 RepID=A0A369ALX2_9FIRM|nr:response regulator transcription factor [Anaerobacterium chartisolvens]RCX10370.1 DNA-binding response OmpR family regulator [Anaerobacterium chartisolvens]